jgi:hypothetical protein
MLETRNVYLAIRREDARRLSTCSCILYLSLLVYLFVECIHTGAISRDALEVS